MFIKIVLGLQGYSGAGMICPTRSEPLREAAGTEQLLRLCCRDLNRTFHEKACHGQKCDSKQQAGFQSPHPQDTPPLWLQESKYRPGWWCEDISFNFAPLYSFPSNRKEINPVLSRSASYLPIGPWNEPSFWGWFFGFCSRVHALAIWPHYLFSFWWLQCLHSYWHFLLVPTNIYVCPLTEKMSSTLCQPWSGPLSSSFLSQNLHCTSVSLAIPQATTVWLWLVLPEHLRPLTGHLPTAKSSESLQPLHLTSLGVICDHPLCLGFVLQFCDFFFSYLSNLSFSVSCMRSSLSVPSQHWYYSGLYP